MFFKKKKREKTPQIRIKESTRQELLASELTPGMYVAELDIPWEESPFLFQGFQLQNWEDVDAVKSCCKTVTIDQSRTVKIKLEKKAVDPLSGHVSHQHMKKAVKAEEEIGKANKIYVQTSKLVRNIMDDIRLGKSIDSQAAKEAVSSTVDSIIRTPDAMLMLTRIKNRDEYTAEHAINVSVLTVAFGRALGLERERLEELGLCGLLHDMGKILTPDEVLYKKGTLTPEEFEIMKKHTTDGRDIIASSGGNFPGAMDVAHSHHERIDGTGYPRGLYEHQTTLWSKIIGITDAFDAITSDRVHKDGRSNMDAFRVLNKNRGTQFDSSLVMKFISAIGIYAPGSIVQLNTGEIAVVIETNPKAALSPKVMILRDKHLQTISPKLIDLNDKVKAPEIGQFYKITSMLRPGDHNIDLHELRAQGFLMDAVTG